MLQDGKADLLQGNGCDRMDFVEGERRLNSKYNKEIGAFIAKKQDEWVESY